MPIQGSNSANGKYVANQNIEMAPASNFDALNDPKKTMFVAKDFDGLSFPFYILVLKDDNFIMPSKWDATNNKTVGRAKDYKAGDIITVTAMALDTKPNALKDKLLITDDGKAIWGEGLRPADQTFSAAKPSGTAVSAATLDATKAAKSQVIPTVFSSVGLLGGLYYAHKKGSGFWGYVGYAILGSVVLGTVGQIGNSVLHKE